MKKKLKTKEFIFDGTISLNDTVDITDPCYDKDVWCRNTLTNILPGTYKCYHHIDDDGRIGQSLIVHEEFETDLFNNDLHRSNNDYWIGVDAGLAGYFDDKPNFNDVEWATFCDTISYSEGNFFTKENEVNPSGYFTESGWGDGEYCVKVYKNKKNTIVALNMIFD